MSYNHTNNICKCIYTRARASTHAHTHTHSFLNNFNFLACLSHFNVSKVSNACPRPTFKCWIRD